MKPADSEIFLAKQYFSETRFSFMNQEAKLQHLAQKFADYREYLLQGIESNTLPEELELDEKS